MRSLALLGLLALSCNVGGVPAAAGGVPGAAKPLKACGAHSFTVPTAAGWRHKSSSITSASGAPGHSVQDVIVPAGAPVTLNGKFAYGTFSKDLEEEPVRVYLDTCDGWTMLGEAETDDDGRIAFTVSQPLAEGIYGVRLVVLGDGSAAEGAVYVLAPGSHLIVSDIDGTLTTSDEELIKDIEADLFRPLLKGDYVPKAYPGGQALTAAHAARGATVVYLTGRPYWLAGSTRQWLSSQGFAPGPLHVTDSNREALMNNDGVGAFKLKFLEQLKASGFVIDYVYGNATTDIYAYLGAKLAPQNVYIIGPHAGEQGTQAVKDSWETEAARVKALPKL
jgi:phosphatidate phosphatase PAH1